MEQANEVAPPGWGADSLSQFLELAQQNTWATFVQLQDEYAHLRKIDSIFRILSGSTFNESDCLEVLFLQRACMAYLGAVRLVMAVELAEAYMVLRGCLESSLYGFYVHKNPESGKRWLSRHESQKSLIDVKKEFQFGKLRSFLEKTDQPTSQAVEKLYNRTIDYGAHPNERAFTSNLELTRQDGAVQFDQVSPSNNPVPLKACLKSTAEIGLCSLLIFKLIFTTRFELLDLPNQLERLKHELIKPRRSSVILNAKR